MTGSLAGCSDSPARAKPNIVLVTVDTLRADHLEVYGYDRRTAPNLARLASTGIRFSHAMAQAPWTLPSMASLHSSLYPIQHGYWHEVMESGLQAEEAAESAAASS